MGLVRGVVYKEKAKRLNCLIQNVVINRKPLEGESCQRQREVKPKNPLRVLGDVDGD